MNFSEMFTVTIFQENFAFVVAMYPRVYTGTLRDGEKCSVSSSIIICIDLCVSSCRQCRQQSQFRILQVQSVDNKLSPN